MKCAHDFAKTSKLILTGKYYGEIRYFRCYRCIHCGAQDYRLEQVYKRDWQQSR
ncbi:MAG: hypothetical protein VB050_03360 [Geobacteraceae bacterium]|nr:hypothetical protein [Geobacteraceae bacterium]